MMCERILCDLPVNVTVDKSQDLTETSDFDSTNEVFFSLQLLLVRSLNCAFKFDSLSSLLIKLPLYTMNCVEYTNSKCK